MQKLHVKYGSTIRALVLRLRVDTECGSRWCDSFFYLLVKKASQILPGDDKIPTCCFVKQLRVMSTLGKKRDFEQTKNAMRRHVYSLVGECGKVVRVERLRIDRSGTNFKGCRGIIVRIFVVLRIFLNTPISIL